jgi:hypothetical protein
MAKSLKLSDGYLLHVLLFVIAAILVYHFVFGNKKDGFFGVKQDACTKNNGKLKENGKNCSYVISNRMYSGTCYNGYCQSSR